MSTTPKHRTYSHLTVQPPNEDGACEVWGAFDVTLKGMGSFASDGIIGYLYKVGISPVRWVWINEAGHPTLVMDSNEEVAGWLQSLSPSIDWAETYRQPEDRG